MLAYLSQKCLTNTFPSLWIPAGQSSYLFGLGLFRRVEENTGITHKFQSIGPDPNAEYFKINCNRGSSTISILEPVNTVWLNSGSISGLYTKNESSQLGLLMGVLQHISRKIDEIKQVNQQTVLNFANAMNDIEEQLRKQRDDFQDLMDKIKRDLTKILA